MAFPQYPAVYSADGDGNVPPELGGTEAIKFFPFTFATVANTRAFTLPGGPTIVAMILVVNDVFNNSPTLSVGDDVSATDLLNAASALDTAGPVYSVSWLTKNQWFTKFASPKNIKVVIGGTPNAGTGVLWCRYVMQ